MVCSGVCRSPLPRVYHSHRLLSNRLETRAKPPRLQTLTRASPRWVQAEVSAKDCTVDEEMQHVSLLEQQSRVCLLAGCRTYLPFFVRISLDLHGPVIAGDPSGLCVL